MVSLAVAFFSTAAGSVFDHVHQVDAEELTGAEVTAAAAVGGRQVVAIPDWGVHLTLPLAADMPAVRYTTRTGSSVGLSSVSLEQLGSACLASHSGLGSLVRLGAGEFDREMQGNSSMHFIGTIAGYDYAYFAPQNGCSDSPEASNMINVQESVIFGGLETLTN